MDEKPPLALEEVVVVGVVDRSGESVAPASDARARSPGDPAEERMALMPGAPGGARGLCWQRGEEASPSPYIELKLIDFSGSNLTQICWLQRSRPLAAVLA